MMKFLEIAFKRGSNYVCYCGFWNILLLLRGYCLLVCFLFKEPPYFTAEPESRILVEVEETVDIMCRAMGKWEQQLDWSLVWRKDNGSVVLPGRQWVHRLGAISGEWKSPITRPGLWGCPWPGLALASLPVTWSTDIYLLPTSSIPNREATTWSGDSLQALRFHRVWPLDSPHRKHILMGRQSIPVHIGDCFFF